MKRGSVARRRIVERVAVALCVAALILALLPLGHVLYTALTLGGSKLNLAFLTQPVDPNGVPYIGAQGGVLNGLAGTAILLFIGGLIAVPVGVGTGLYLADFGDGRLGGVIRALGDTLLGVPSVVWGLFGYLVFAFGPVGFHWSFSALSGGAVLGLVMMPIVARVTEISMRTVPLAFNEASLALGATRWATTRRIGLRVATPGILTGVLLALTNAIGQTVALLLTNGYTYYMPKWPLWGQGNQVTDLGSLIYVYVNAPTTKLQAPAEAAVAVLLALVLVFSLLSRALAALGRRNYAG